MNALDRQINEATVPADMPSVPQMAQIRELRRERNIWLVASADSGLFSSAVLAKAAGYNTMSGYRQALFRARKALSALNG